MNSNQFEPLRSLCRDEVSFQELQQYLQQHATLVTERNTTIERQQALFRVIAKIRETLDLDTIFKSTATEVRQLLNVDRVGMFRFYPNSGYDDGEFVSEDVLPPYDSALAAKIHDHCFGEQYAIDYVKGRIQAVADIHNAGLQDCHVEVLARFQIRANLVVPLLQGDHLWGLLCIHQCSAPREWHLDEIEFVQQISHHLGVALQQAELLEREQYRAEQQRAIFGVVNRIRESLSLDNIFKATATEVRQLLNADRVGVFRFYLDSGYDDGEFVSEDVLPPYDSALAAKIHDHCFGEQYAIDYVKGRIQAVADIHNAGLQDCHIEVLSRFQIRANLIVPLLQGDFLWGLLCIHQCSGPRQWTEDEIEFVQQIATQLSIALKQAELLEQTQQQATDLAEALRTLQKAQTQLIQNEKMSSLGQLVAGIAHEINNPVNFIYGNLNYATQYAHDLLELLNLYAKEYPQPSDDLSDRLEEVDIEFVKTDFPKMLASMQMGADRIRNIVLSLRKFSRLDEAEMKPVDIHEGIDSTLLILQYRLKPKSGTMGITVHKDYGDLPEVECYPSQLNQVFMNILSNAIDALEEQIETAGVDGLEPPHPEISIRTYQRHAEALGDASVVIQIADNGPGIPEHIQSKLFDPFFTTKPSGKGTGLGLSISYQILVERHGGTLQCNSQPGQGTEFLIEVPVHQTQTSVEAGAIAQK
jgi:signal transduction histidine kinase